LNIRLNPYLIFYIQKYFRPVYNDIRGRFVHTQINALTHYLPQGMAGMNLFDTFEEEHMESASRPRYNTRARARQHSASQAQFLVPRIFRPISFTNNQGVAVSPRQAPNNIPMANAVINQYSGTSVEYRHLIQDETTFPV
jgi:hypothetical protein